MNRRTLLRTAGFGGVAAVAGCLESDNEPTVGSDSGGPASYNRPTDSEWTPAESHTGDGVLFAQMELASLRPIQEAIETDRLDASQPLVGLPRYGVERLTTAVESLSAYPFEGALRQSINAAVRPDEDHATETNQTLVEPATDSVLPTDESVTNESATNESTTNETTATDELDPVTAADIGIEPERLALIDDVVLLEGRFDHTAFVEQFGDSFERVDTQRSVAIYEGVDDLSGLAFALDGSRLLVPTERPGQRFDTRPVGEATSGEPDDETVLAHLMSGYSSTVGRIVDTDDGQWLFETTGQPALSVGLWELPFGDLGAEINLAETERDSLFESVGSCLSGLAVSDGEQSAEFEARFSGLFPAGSPSDEDLQAALAGDSEPESIYSETPRAHLTTDPQAL